MRSPTIRRRELGALLRAMRAESGMTVEQVAESLLISPSKVSRLETGQRGASARDVRDLCDLYGVTDPARREHLGALAREGRGQAWWQPYDLPYATYVGLEEAAVAICDFEPGVFPGLLQAPDYARAIHEGAMPRLTRAIIDQRIEVRKNRQSILERTEPRPPQLRVIIEETVLRRPIGGPEVMAAQLDHVIAACGRPHISVQVLPFEAGAHPALDSTFTLMDFADPVPAVVYVEGLVGQVYLERAQDVQRYRAVFERLGELSLSAEDSIGMLVEACAAYKGPAPS